MTKLAIVGSTILTGNAQAQERIDWAFATYKPTLLVSGGADGIDTMAEETAIRLGIAQQIFRPTSKRWAGPGGYQERNQQIADLCDRLVRITSTQTKTYGSGWTRDRAAEQGKPTEEFVIVQQPLIKPWTQAEIDYALNIILPATSSERYNGLCDKLAAELKREPKAINRVIWGLATRLTDIDYDPGPVRCVRLSVSYMDAQMIRWATMAHTKDDRRKNGPATPEYMAKILGHSLETVKDLWIKHGPAKGRRGFFDG